MLFSRDIATRILLNPGTEPDKKWPEGPPNVLTMKQPVHIQVQDTPPRRVNMEVDDR
jgi:hypothetical protein